MSLPLPHTPDRSGPPPRPLLFVSRISPSQSSSATRHIIKSDKARDHRNDHAEVTATLLSVTTLRPLATAKRSSPKLIPSLQSTIKYLTPLPLQPHLSSFQQILNRLSPRSPILQESEATARPTRSPVPGIEGVKVDEMVHEVCWKCTKERETEEMELRRVQGHGLQWMCSGGCGNQTEVSAGEPERDAAGAVGNEAQDVL